MSTKFYNIANLCTLGIARKLHTLIFGKLRNRVCLYQGQRINKFCKKPFS